MNIEREIELIFNKVGLDNRKETQKEVIALIYKYTEALQLLQANVVGRSEQLCECEIPKPIDSYDSIDKNICRDCKCIIALFLLLQNAKQCLELRNPYVSD